MTKTIAVFGAGPGFGRAIAHRFGREGFRVALVARTQAKLDRLVAELTAAGIEAAGFAADLRDRRQLAPVAEAITGRFGSIDVIEYAPAGPDWMRQHVDMDQVSISAIGSQWVDSGPRSGAACSSGAAAASNASRSRLNGG